MLMKFNLTALHFLNVIDNKLVSLFCVKFVVKLNIINLKVNHYLKVYI